LSTTSSPAAVASGSLSGSLPMSSWTTTPPTKTPKIKAWLARRPHYYVHFTPTSASRINQIERWFAELIRKQIQRGLHTSARQLEADIRTSIELPKPFKWTKSADRSWLPSNASAQSPADFVSRTLDSRD
jgi:hypothetical protein